MAEMKAKEFMPFNVKKTCSGSVLDKTIQRSTELTVSLRMRKNILFALGANDLFNHIGGFSLAFMIDPHEHLTEKAHSDKLNPNDDQESTEQEKRSPSDIASEKDFIYSQVKGYEETEESAYDTYGAEELNWFCGKALEKFYGN